MFVFLFPPSALSDDECDVVYLLYAAANFLNLIMFFYFFVYLITYRKFCSELCSLFCCCCRPTSVVAVAAAAPAVDEVDNLSPEMCKLPPMLGLKASAVFNPKQMFQQ